MTSDDGAQVDDCLCVGTTSSDRIASVAGMTEDEFTDGNEIAIAVPLPDGAVFVSAVVAISYLAPDGASQYAVASRGEARMLPTLGLLKVAEVEVLKWGSGE